MELIFQKRTSKGKIYRVRTRKKNGESIEPSVATLGIVLKGRVSFRQENKREIPLDWGQLFLLPPGDSCLLPFEESSELLLFEVPDVLSFIKHFLPVGLSKEKASFERACNPLEITPLLWEYTRNLKVLIEEIPFPSSLVGVKLCELFSLLNASYHKKELAGLFFPLLSEEQGFRQFIYHNYRHVKTVEELARLSGHSITAFENRFKETFQMPPYKWIMQRKKEILCHELIHSDTPIQELSDKCGFSSPSQMNDFCKKHIGLTPGMIRRGK